MQFFFMACCTGSGSIEARTRGSRGRRTPALLHALQQPVPLPAAEATAPSWGGPSVGQGGDAALTHMPAPSLADQLDELLASSAPRDYDPQDLESTTADDGGLRAGAGNDGLGDDELGADDGRLLLRSTLDDALDPDVPNSRYAGRVLSRQALRSDEDGTVAKGDFVSSSSDEDDGSSDGDDNTGVTLGLAAEQQESEEGEESEAEGERTRRRRLRAEATQLREAKKEKTAMLARGSSSDNSRTESDDDEEEEEEEEEEKESDEDEDDEEDEDEQDTEDGDGGSDGALNMGAMMSSVADAVDDVSKGQHIQTQKRLWDSCLQLRMWMQPALETARRLPPPPTIAMARAQATTTVSAETQSKRRNSKKRSSCSFSCSSEDTQLLQQVVTRLDEASNELAGLVDDMCGLQSALVRHNPETVAAVTRSHKFQRVEEGEEEGVTAGTSSSPPEKRLRALEEELQPYLRQTLDRWGRRVQSAAIGAQVTSSFKALAKPVSEQVDELMSTNRERLLTRTRVKRTPYQVLGVPEAEDGGGGGGDNDAPDGGDDLAGGGVSGRQSQYDYDMEAYDDSDLYQQLLKELVEGGAAGVSGGGGGSTSAQWLRAAEQRHRTKLHRKVDRAASKGRKPRYTIQEKLVNFMAPVAMPGDHDEDGGRVFQGRVDLRGSLFGE
jgi:protein AATF/BFR2